MGWRRILSILTLLTGLIGLGLTLSKLAIVYAYLINHATFVTKLNIPKSYGPCKVCRDLFLIYDISSSLNNAQTIEGHVVFRQGSFEVGCNRFVGYYSGVYNLEPIVDFGNGGWFVVFATPQIVVNNLRVSLPLTGREYIIHLTDIGGKTLEINVGKLLLDFGSFTYIRGEYLSDEIFDAQRAMSAYNGELGFIYAYGASDAELGNYIAKPTTLIVYCRYLTKETLADSPIIQKIDSAVLAWGYHEVHEYLRVHLENYYYTLELGLLARAFWLNGSLVNLPSVGIVDGYIPTRYWRILKVYPGSAFSRGHPVVMHDAYMYYIYYVVPNAVFHVVVGPGVLVFRVGRVGYVCKLRRDVLTVALPTDWNTTVEYICYSNLTRVHFVSVVEGVNSTLNVETIDVGMFVLDGSNYTFPRDFLMRPGSKHSIKLLNDTIRINATCILLLKPVRWDLYECARNDTLCSMNDYVFVKSLPISTTFDVGKRGLELIGIYRGVLECNRTVIKITSRPILGVSIYYMAEYNNTILTAGIGKTPFILVLPPGTYLTLIAPDTVKRGNITYSFSYWTGLAKSEITKITFKVNKSGTEIAYYVNASLRIGSALCPVVFVSSLSRVWSLMYGDSESAIVSKVGNVWELCECSCMYRVLCCPNESDGKCFWTSCGVTSCPAGYVVRDVVCCSFHKSCTGKSNDVISVTSSRALRDVSKRWVRVLEAGTLRLPVLDGSGWKMCAGLYLQSARLNVFSRTFLRSSVSMSTSLSMHCGCKVKISKKASAIASIVSLTINFLLQGRGNIPILDISRNIEHVFNIGKTVTVENGGSNSTSWNGDWRTSVERYNTYTTYDVYNIAGGRYRKSMIIAVSRYEPSSFLTSNVYLSLSITHKPDRFNCSCSRCGVSCTCSANVRTLAKAKATLTAKTSITGGELILRAGLAEKGGGWLKPRFGELTCNDYGCIWYSNRDPWFHGGDLSIDWSPTYPLPGQRVNITIIFDTGDSQPVRLWVYRVIERVWVNGHVTTRVYSLRLVTPWEIKTVLHGWKYVSHSLKMIADPGHAKISFTWKMPNGVLEVCALGWGIFTRLVNKCWIITPPIVIVDIFPICVLPIIENMRVVGYYGFASGQDIAMPEEPILYAVLVRVYVAGRYSLSLYFTRSLGYAYYEYGNIDVKYYVNTISNVFTLSRGIWLILLPIGKVYPWYGYDSVVTISNTTIPIFVTPSLPSNLDYATYMVEATFSTYFRYREPNAISKIVLTHVVSSYYMLRHYLLPIVKWAICLEDPTAEECHGMSYVLGRVFTLYLTCGGVSLQYLTTSWYSGNTPTRVITEKACNGYGIACNYPIGALPAIASPEVIYDYVNHLCSLWLVDTYLPNLAKYVIYRIRSIEIRYVRASEYHVTLNDKTLIVTAPRSDILLRVDACAYGRKVCISRLILTGYDSVILPLEELDKIKSPEVYIVATIMPTRIDIVELKRSFTIYVRVG